MTLAPPARALGAAHRAVLVLFALAGITFAAWASRIADAKSILGLTPGELGSTLLALSLGSVTGLPLAGRIAHRIGVARTIRAAMVVSFLGILLVGYAVDVAVSRPLLAAGLYLVGTGVGVWDVAMNLEGAAVERLLGRTVMPHYHAAFSGGTIVSALLGSLASWAGSPLLLHLGLAVGASLVAGLVALRSVLPRAAEEEPLETRETVQAPRSAWLEPRTLLIGVVTLVAAFTEGTANDWLAVAFVEGHSLPPWAGVLGFATFLTSMTLGRIAGARLLDTYGRVPVLRVAFVVAVLGSLLVVYGGPVLAFVGAAAWGAGVALGFPVGMSASADDPDRAAARMSVVATIGYLAFIAGPPLLGHLGDRVGVLHSLLAVGVMATVALAALPAVREPGGREAGRHTGAGDFG